jgi:amino acid transporter
MTHHKRLGGRALELILLAAPIACSIGLIGGGAYLGATFGPSKGILAGAFIGGGAAWLLWLGFLEYYKYDTNTLRPLDEDKEEK